MLKIYERHDDDELFKRETKLLRDHLVRCYEHSKYIEKVSHGYIQVEDTVERISEVLYKKFYDAHMSEWFQDMDVRLNYAQEAIESTRDVEGIRKKFLKAGTGTSGGSGSGPDGSGSGGPGGA